jgi:hypothetical protein
VPSQDDVMKIATRMQLKWLCLGADCCIIPPRSFAEEEGDISGAASRLHCKGGAAASLDETHSETCRKTTTQVHMVGATRQRPPD